MELYLLRIANVAPIGDKLGYCIGHLEVDGKYICDTLEPYDRGLDQNFGKFKCAQMKVPGATAIPTGRYEVNMCAPSARFGAQDFYKRLCSGCVPRLIDVPGFDGVLIHVGNYAKDTQGCILPGMNTVKGMVSSSKIVFSSLYNIMLKGFQRDHKLRITISRCYNA